MEEQLLKILECIHRADDSKVPVEGRLLYIHALRLMVDLGQEAQKELDKLDDE